MRKEGRNAGAGKEERGEYMEKVHLFYKQFTGVIAFIFLDHFMKHYIHFRDRIITLTMFQAL